MIEVEKIRKSYNMKQKDLAETLGISARLLHRYEKGEIEPNIDMLKKMANALSTNVDTILGYESPMLDLRKLSETQNELIEQVLEMSPSQQLLVLGYIQGMRNKGN